MRSRLVLLVVSLATVTACTGQGATESPETGERTPVDLIRVGEPYAYSEPAPPDEPTPLDGRYVRTLSIAETGGEPVYCQRCAPWRLDAGESELRIERGRFYVRFEPVETARRCRDCKRPPDFEATGHLRVAGDEVQLFNDANCIGMTGTYRWSRARGRLSFELVEDECPFVRLRARYLTAAPWDES